MERSDIELIERYVNTDDALKKLYNEHLELEQKLDAYNHKKHLTADEETEKINLKKHKLRGKDQIENILRKYRNSRSA